jgi:acyl carrier protein
MENALKIVIDEIRQLASEGSAPPELADKRLGADTKLSDLNLDSLGKLSLLSAVEDKADVILGEGDIQHLQTLGELARILFESAAVTV